MMGKAGKAKTILLVFSFIRPGSGRFGVGFWVGLRAWDFPTERVLSRAPLIIRTVDQIAKRSEKLNRRILSYSIY